MSSTESRGGWAGLAEGLRPHSAEGVGSVLGGGGVFPFQAGLMAFGMLSLEEPGRVSGCSGL